MPRSPLLTSAIPLTGWAQDRLDRLADLVPSAALPEAGALLGERAASHGFSVPARISCQGGCRFYRTHDGWVALNLARRADRDLLPALFSSDAVIDLDAAFAAIAQDEAVARGRLLGMAIAGLSETPVSPALAVTARGPARAAPARRPRVLDLTALWAGPLAGRLLHLCGAQVTRVVSAGREDPLEHSDPAHFASLAAGKASCRLDLRTGEGRAQLASLIARSDIVIEAARPRALRQLGFDADQLVREHPGLVWLTITGHGIAEEAGNWVGFGDDTAVAGGLSARLLAATGHVGFVGDAIADPLSGILAAQTAMACHRRGEAARIVLSMSASVALAITEDRTLTRDLAAWGARIGRPLVAPAVPC